MPLAVVASASLYWASPCTTFSADAVVTMLMKTFRRNSLQGVTTNTNTPSSVIMLQGRQFIKAMKYTALRRNTKFKFEHIMQPLHQIIEDIARADEEIAPPAGNSISTLNYIP
jgi:hypothetical protein